MIAFSLLFGAVPAHGTQEATQPQTPEKQEKEKSQPEQKALFLLEQVIAEARILRLPENRIRIQIAAADLLWSRDESRARSLFGEAAAIVTEMIQRHDPNDRQSFVLIRSAGQLRQELLLSIARRDATLAYQFLQTIPQPPSIGRDGRGPDSEAALEQNLIVQIAEHDPALAFRSAQEWVDKGQYSAAITNVLAKLHVKDKDSAAKLAERLVKRLLSEDLLANQDAARLSLSLLRPGPRPASEGSGETQTPQRNTSQVLTESGYRDLMEAVVSAALRATPEAAGNRRGAAAALRRNPNMPRGAQTNPQAAQSDPQNQQAGARALVRGLQSMLPQIDQHAPARSLAVRQKINEISGSNNPRAPEGRMAPLLQQNTADSLMAAAAMAPPGMQARLYNQAALKALDEGNADRARQIANQHLDPAMRSTVLQTIDLKQSARSAGANTVEEVRRELTRLQSDEERARLLLRFVGVTQKENPNIALQLFDEARNLVMRRATNYRQFEAQLNVARAFAVLDPSRSFELLEPGISQINELLSAAALLSGFEVSIFREGELPIQDGSRLTEMVARYGQELATLAKADFERAQMTADRFQLAEPRIMARLAIIRGVLGVTPVELPERGFEGEFGGRDFPFFRRPQ